MHKQQYADAEDRGLLGKLCPGDKRLEGKIFYLDNVKKRPTALLLETISLLGGRVESFLHKDVNFVVTGNQEVLKEERSVATKGGAKGTNEKAAHPVTRRESVLSREKQRPETPRPMACGSRGKALLEKAIRNNERLQGNSVLSNARSWGVKILYVDDVLLNLKQLTRESFNMKHKRPEKTQAKQQGSHVVKAAALRSPYLKIEDLSQKYKPLHMQSMTFPSLCYRGRFSPFESPPPQFEKQTEQGTKTREKKKVESSIQDKSQTPFNCSPSPWRPRKKDTSYCECCHQPFTNLEEHLQSDQHRMFVLDPSNYSVVDQLVVDMLPGFNPFPSQQSDEALNRPPTPLPIQDICELEPLDDVETECAVQALRTQDLSFSTHISSPIKGPLSFGPASPSAGLQCPTLCPAIQPFTPTKGQFPDSHPHASSPVMPVLDAEPQTHTSTSKQLFPRPGTPCQFPDPYPLPPVLSPQLPCSSYTPHSPYSDPPILSPQLYITEETEEGVVCKMDTAEILSESVSAVANQDDLLVFSKIICTRNGLECDGLLSHRSRSLPRESATAPNPRKRCRSASPECTHSKRRRITVKFGYRCEWTEQGHRPANPVSDLMAKPEDKASCQNSQCGPHPEVYSTCTVDLKQAFTTFCVPNVNFTSAPSQTDILGHGGTSAAALSKAKASGPQLRKSKSHSAFSSQDSQRSLSHSTSVCIESALIPDLAALSSSSSDSDWDCHLLSRLDTTSAAPLSPTGQSCELDKELLHRPCTWMHDTSYESRLHTVLQPATPATSLCGEEMDPSAFSRTVVQIVEVQH
ncbi:hypothetical protein INR49_013733 [Caranx melampygus]|nr:hypothetical protein INR49_013733 [Caranx melampygus]